MHFIFLTLVSSLLLQISQLSRLKKTNNGERGEREISLSLRINGKTLYYLVVFFIFRVKSQWIVV